MSLGDSNFKKYRSTGEKKQQLAKNSEKSQPERKKKKTTGKDVQKYKYSNVEVINKLEINIFYEEKHGNISDWRSLRKNGRSSIEESKTRQILQGVCCKDSP